MRCLVHAPAARPATPIVAASAWSEVSGSVVMLAGLLTGRGLRLRALDLVGSLVVSATLHAGRTTDFRLPDWLLASAQGATIGCGFGGLTLRNLVRVTPWTGGWTLVLLTRTFGLALILNLSNRHRWRSLIRRAAWPKGAWSRSASL